VKISVVSMNVDLGLDGRKILKQILNRMVGCRVALSELE
jgi:hypothetical protein